VILEAGIKVLAVNRRLFERDQLEYFVGTVDDYEAGMVRMTGHAWLRDALTGLFRRKKDARTEIACLSAGTVVLYQLPAALDLSSLVVEAKDASTWLRNAEGFQMDLSEGSTRDKDPGAGPRLRRSA